VDFAGYTVDIMKSPNEQISYPLDNYLNCLAVTGVGSWLSATTDNGTRASASHTNSFTGIGAYFPLIAEQTPALQQRWFRSMEIDILKG